MAKQFSDKEIFIIRTLSPNMSSREVTYWLYKSGFDRSAYGVSNYMKRHGLLQSKTELLKKKVIRTIQNHPGCSGRRLSMLMDVQYNSSIRNALKELESENKIEIVNGERSANLHYIYGRAPKPAKSIPAAAKSLADLGALPDPFARRAL